MVPRRSDLDLLRPLATPLLLYLSSRLVTFAGAWMAVILSGRGTLVARLATWDGDFYVDIAVHGYPHAASAPGPTDIAFQNNLAFFPLYSLLIRAGTAILPLSAISVAVLIALGCGAAATVAVWLLAHSIAGRAVADRSAAFFCFFPGAFVMSMAYSEALMVALAAGCLLCLVRRWWLLAGVLAALASATRSSGLVLVICCAWAAGEAIVRRREWRAIVAPVLAPLGAAAYLLYLHVHTGSARTWLTVERHGWGERVDFGRQTLTTAWAFVRDPTANIQVTILGIGMIFVVLALVALGRACLPMPVTLYAIAIIGLSVLSATLDVRPRFIFTAFPLLIAVAYVVRGRRFTALIGASAGGLALLATLYALRFHTVLPSGKTLQLFP